MQVVAWLKGLGNTNCICMTLEPEAGDQRLEISPRGFRNETYMAEILPGAEEQLEAIRCRYGSDPNAWTELITLSKEDARAEQKSRMANGWAGTIHALSLITPDGFYGPGQTPVTLDDLRRWLGTETIAEVVALAYQKEGLPLPPEDEWILGPL